MGVTHSVARWWSVDRRTGLASISRQRVNWFVICRWVVRLAWVRCRVLVVLWGVVRLAWACYVVGVANRWVWQTGVGTVQSVGCVMWRVWQTGGSRQTGKVGTVQFSLA